MSADDASSYRPKSPDLSSFFSGPTEPSASAPAAEPALPASSAPPPSSSHHQQPHYHQPQHYQHNPHHLQQHQPSLDPYLQQHQPPPSNHQQHYPPNPQPYDYPSNAQPTGYGYGSPSFSGQPYTNPASPHGIKSEDQPPYFPPAQGSIPISQPAAFHHSPAGHDLFHHQPHQPPFNQPYIDSSFPHYAGGGSYVPSYQPGTVVDHKSLSDASQHPIKFEQVTPMEQAQAPRPPPVNLPDPSPVKTKFPTARIKRIMQADEEVGKVAQQTPIAVGKALEMFMVQMVLTSADVAREKGSKRVTAQMLKQVVETDEQWDFLRDIVSKVETNEKSGKGGPAKAESDSDDDEPKKRKGGRKRKTG